MKRVLLVLLLLGPWLVAVWVGLHNLRQPRRLQLLTGTTPSLPIGGWLLVSSSLGVTLGATAVGVLLQTDRFPRRRRWSRASQGETIHDDEDGAGREEANPGHWRGAESGLGEPPPIMDVPFRVVRPVRPSGPAPDASPPPPYNGDDWQPPEPGGW